jgi:hypothetical protein
MFLILHLGGEEVATLKAEVLTGFKAIFSEA